MSAYIVIREGDGLGCVFAMHEHVKYRGLYTMRPLNNPGEKWRLKRYAVKKSAERTAAEYSGIEGRPYRAAVILEGKAGEDERLQGLRA